MINRIRYSKLKDYFNPTSLVIKCCLRNRHCEFLRSDLIVGYSKFSRNATSQDCHNCMAFTMTSIFF